MTPPTPAEQIRRFIERHPGEWAQWSREGTRYAVAYAVLRLHNLPNVCVTIGHEGAVVHTRTGGEAGEILPVLVKAPPGADLLTKIVFRVADSLQLHGGTCDTLPPWLAGPVSHQFINRARALLTSAGISPADAVMAAETLDEALCQRAPVAPTFSAVINALRAIGMSCRWVADPVKPAAPKADPAFYRALLDAAKPPETT